MNLSDILADLAIERQLDLNRYIGSVQNDIAKLLKDIVHEVEGKLRGDLTEYNQRRLERLLSEIKVYVSEEYGLFFEDFEADLIRLAQDETRWVASSMNQTVGSSLLTVLPSADALKTLVRKDLLQGAPLEAWFKEQSRDVQFRITNAIRQGVAQGETNGQIMARLKGIEGRMASGQVIPIVGRNLEALTRTAVQSVTNKVRNNVYESNTDIVKALQQVSTLDSRTSVLCISYSGKTWDVKTKEPIDHNLPFNGGTPRHWNCRSVTIPVTKSFRELGLDVDDFQPSTRAAIDGQVAADQTFEQFLERKGKEFQDRTLGAGRADLWREGKITLTQLLDARGRPLTLTELRRKYDN